jgi:hypothetical protein
LFFFNYSLFHSFIHTFSLFFSSLFRVPIPSHAQDAALARRFQPILIAEPSVQATITMLRGLKERYEIHHGVRITDEAIVAAAVNSNRYA